MTATASRRAFLSTGAAAATMVGVPAGSLAASGPAIDLDTVFVEGTDTASLQSGPGHYTRSDEEATRSRGDGSAFPGQGQTVGIAGHRTTYGAPFRRVDAFDPGDRIELRMPYGRFVYRVERTRIVAPTATWVTRRVAYDRLVLTACHPLYSAAQRIVVFARLERTG